jgi:RNA polymerase sigma-70 factor (ECF subfamily)
MTPDPLLEPHRAALTGHCYRMLGSLVDAEDAVQDTMLRAWKARERFDGRASMRTWLVRIATNVCLDTLGAGERRRVRAMDRTPEPHEVRDDMPLVRRDASHWLEPVPDVLAIPADDDSHPERRALSRESIRLAFVAALQFLPPRQRAVLLLTQVLDWSAAETASALDMTVAAVNSALQRARATLAARSPAMVPRELDAPQAALLARYVDAFERHDVAALAALLHEEATMSMPPYDLWLRGPASVARWLTTIGAGCRGSRLVAVGTANGGMPAFAQYRDGGATPWALVVLEGSGDRIAHQHFFLETATLFPRFGAPMRLDDATSSGAAPVARGTLAAVR